MIGDGSYHSLGCVSSANSASHEELLLMIRCHRDEERSFFLGSLVVRFDRERRCVLGSNGCRSRRHCVVIYLRGDSGDVV